MDKKVNDFLVFCIEIFKNESRLKGEDVYDLFEKYGVLEYLTNGYDMLHTQGAGWIINDINEFLHVRGYDIK